MTSPYSGATPVGSSPGYGDPQANYVAPDAYGAHSGPPVSGEFGTPMTAEGHPDVEGTSVGQLMGEVAKDLSTLMRQELELAKVEVKAEATKAATGVLDLPPDDFRVTAGHWCNSLQSEVWGVSWA